jgi:hypothetical protein
MSKRMSPSGLTCIFPTSLSKLNSLTSSPSLLLNRASFPTVNITSREVSGRPLVLVMRMVVCPSSPVSSDLVCTVAVRLEIAARHLATISAASSVSKSLVAASLKNSAVSSGICLHAIAEVVAAALRAASVDGGPASSNLKPCPRSLSIRTISRDWPGLNKRIETPLFPARPVLPERCTYVSTSRGGSN